MALLKTLLNGHGELPKPKNFWVNAVINSHGLFTFFEDPCLAVVMLMVMASMNWWLVLSSIISCISANVFAVFVLNSPRDDIQAGFIGINSVHLGLCLGVAHPPTLKMAMAVVSLACTTMAFRHIMQHGFEQIGLSAGAFPQMILLFLWDSGLRDMLGIDPYPAPPPMHQAVDPIQGVLVGFANVHFLTPMFSTLVLVNVLWLLTAPAVLISTWLGAAVGVLVDVTTGAPASHFWTGFSGLNAILTNNVITCVYCTPSPQVFLAAAGFTACAALGARVLGVGGSTWPSATMLLLFCVVKNEWTRKQAAVDAKKKDASEPEPSKDSKKKN